jgi:hypothetical protein
MRSDLKAFLLSNWRSLRSRGVWAVGVVGGAPLDEHFPGLPGQPGRYALVGRLAVDAARPDPVKCSPPNANRCGDHRWRSGTSAVTGS